MPVVNSPRRLSGMVALALVAASAAACGGTAAGSATSTSHATTSARPTTTTRPASTSTSTSAPATTSTSTTTNSPPSTLGAPGPGIVAGHVTAVGDSVMIDQQPDLQADIPGIDVEAFVSFQWYQGVALVQQLKAEGRLGQTLVVGLGTNGPVTAADFDAMIEAASGVSRIVFITVHVDRPWEAEVNSTLEAGVARYPNLAVLADWNALANQNPGWFYSDGTHLPVGGPGAQALAALVASKVKG